MTLQDVYDNFILSRRLADLSPKTIYDYEQFIKPFLQFIGAQRAFFSITQADLTSYLGKLLSRPLSKSTRATYIRHVKIFLRWAQKEYKAAYMAETIRVPRSLRGKAFRQSAPECSLYRFPQTALSVGDAVFLLLSVARVSFNAFPCFIELKCSTTFF